jgi:hypothetical protein
MALASTALGETCLELWARVQAQPAIELSALHFPHSSAACIPLDSLLRSSALTHTQLAVSVPTTFARLNGPVGHSVEGQEVCRTALYSLDLGWSPEEHTGSNLTLLRMNDQCVSQLLSYQRHWPPSVSLRLPLHFPSCRLRTLPPLLLFAPLPARGVVKHFCLTFELSRLSPSSLF